MSRCIDAYKFYARKDGEIDRYWLSYWISHAGIGSWDDKREAIRVGGAGMDMGFHIVYSLSSALFRDGFGCIGERCRSNDHTNGDRDYTPHCPFCATRDAGEPVNYGNGTTGPSLHARPEGRAHWHSDGGYALHQKWL